MAQERTIQATEHNDDGLTKGGLFAKGNTRGTPRKKGRKKGRPFGEGYEDFFDRRQAQDTPTIDFKEFSPERRETLAEQNKALPDGSFPIENKRDLVNAIQALGRAKNRTLVAAHIKRRAKALGATLPESLR